MTTTTGNVAEDVLEIANELGMHARAATKFVQTANRFKAECFIEKDGQEVNGKSIMGVLLLAAAKGTQIKVRCVGADAAASLAELTKLVRDKFGEE